MLKCYTRTKPHLAEIYGDKLHPQEIYIHNDEGHGKWVGVVIDQWIEGETLTKTICRAANERNDELLRHLATQFDLLAQRMLSEPSAHGDLKPDNIIVGNDGQLHLIDFDAAYLPSLKGQSASELGTAAWQHPNRLVCDFDRHIDNYPIALISTTLHALATDPTMYGRYADADGILLPARDIISGNHAALQDSFRLFESRGMAAQLRIAQLLCSNSYILPRLARLIDFSLHEQRPCTAPELYCEAGYWGYTEGGEIVVPPLYDTAYTPRNRAAQVMLGEYEHTISFGTSEP